MAQPTPGFAARGQDVTIWLTVDEVEKQCNYTEVELDLGLMINSSEYGGDSRARPYGSNGMPRIRLTGEPTDPFFWDLCEAQMNANEPNAVRKLVNIVVHLTYNYGPGGARRVALEGGVVGNPVARHSGPSEKVRNSCEIAFPSWRKI